MWGQNTTIIIIIITRKQKTEPGFLSNEGFIQAEHIISRSPIHLPRKSFPLQTHFSLEETICIISLLFLEVSFLHLLPLSSVPDLPSTVSQAYILLASSWFLVFLCVFCQGFIYSCEVCIYAVISTGTCLSCSSLQEFTDNTCSYQSLMYTCLRIYSVVWLVSEPVFARLYMISNSNMFKYGPVCSGFGGMSSPCIRHARFLKRV